MPLPHNDSSSSPLIASHNLFFSYRHQPVLKEVTFQIYRNEFVGIIGPNGGGKTTLLKLILGFLKPTQGSLHVFGEPPRLESHQTCRLAYVPQTLRFDRDFPITVEEVVLLGRLRRLPWHGWFQKKERQTAKEALEQVGLAHLAALRFGTLSGGEAQRVLIARALVSQPAILLLDEPTASVDSQAEAEIYAILKKLKERMTILMVTHDLNVAIEQVERVLCVQGNVQSLQPEQICQHFALGLYHPPITPDKRKS